MKNNLDQKVTNYHHNDNDKTHLDVQISGIISDAAYIVLDGANPNNTNQQIDNTNQIILGELNNDDYMKDPVSNQSFTKSENFGAIKQKNDENNKNIFECHSDIDKQETPSEPVKNNNTKDREPENSSDDDE